jgi:hypothetical protein
MLFEQQERLADALVEWTKGRDIAAALVAISPTNAQRKKLLAAFERDLARLQAQQQTGASKRRLSLSPMKYSNDRNSSAFYCTARVWSWALTEPPQCWSDWSAFRGSADVWLRRWTALIRRF